HTRFSRDWSSDVCSSDLLSVYAEEARLDGIPEVDDDPVRIGTEGLKREPNRSHCTSSISRRRPRADATTASSFCEIWSSRTCSRDRKSVVSGKDIGAGVS